MKYLWIIALALILLPAATAIGTGPTPDSNTILYYKLNNNTTTAIDTTNKYNGTIVNTPVFNLTGGILYEGAFTLNGTNQYIRTNQALPLNNTNLSICAWYYNNANYGTNDGIITGFNSILSGNRLRIFQDTNNKTEVLLFNSTGTQILSIVSTASTYRGNWNHICFTFDNTQTYICNNGICEQKANLSNRIDTDFFITPGAGQGTTNYLNGSVDEIIIYNRSLTTQEIWRMYTQYINTACYSPNASINYIGGSTNFCPGNYSANSSGDVFGEGAITLKTSNAVINFNGSSIYGNQTGVGISSNNYNNITIANGSLSGYNRTIFLQNIANSSITNISFYDFGTNALILRNANSTIVQQSTAYGNYTRTQSAFDIGTTNSISKLNTIQNNSAYQTGSGVYLYGNSTNNTIRNNFIYNISNLGMCISTVQTADQNYIYSNLAYYCGWNGIDVGTSYNFIENNTIQYPYHNGIDMFDTTIPNPARFATDSSSFNTVRGNNISELIGTTTFPDAIGIFIVSGNNNIVNNNLIQNSGYGITVYGNISINYNNSIYNNTVNKSHYGVFIYINNNYTQNNLLNIGNYSRYQNPNTTNNASTIIYNSSYSLFHNITNVCTGFYGNINSNNNQTNITLSANDSCYTYKDYKVIEGRQLTLDPISTNRQINAVVITNTLVDNIYNVTITVASGQPLSPTLYHASTGVTENITSYFYNSTAGTFTFNATLTSGSNTLLVDSSSTPNTFTPVQACSAASSSISTFANWLTLLAIVLVVGIVLYVLYGVYSGSLVIDARVIIKAGVGLIIAGIFIVIGVIIVAGAASTCV